MPSATAVSSTLLGALLILSLCGVVAWLAGGAFDAETETIIVPRTANGDDQAGEVLLRKTLSSDIVLAIYDFAKKPHAQLASDDPVLAWWATVADHSQAPAGRFERNEGGFRCIIDIETVEVDEFFWISRVGPGGFLIKSHGTGDDALATLRTIECRKRRHLKYATETRVLSDHEDGRNSRHLTVRLRILERVGSNCTFADFRSYLEHRYPSFEALVRAVHASWEGQ